MTIYMRYLTKRNRVLLRELIITDFKLRYQGSVLGYLWSLLKPMMLFVIMYAVFVHFLRFGEGIPHFISSLFLGMVLWTFFTEATTQGMQAIVNRGDLIRKISFPKFIIVMSATISALINLVLNLCVVLIMMLFNGVDFGWSALLFPVTVMLLYGFSLAIAFLFAAVYVKYRDLAHIWEIFLQGLFYATPILYPLQMVIATSSVAAQVLMLNPVAVFIQNARDQLVREGVVTADQLSTNIFYLIAPYVTFAVICLVAVWYFKKRAPYFAEEV